MNTVKRYLFFLLGLFINSIGVGMITKASLGTSPTSSIPYTLSMGLPFTMGQFTIAFNLLLVLLQIILLRKNFAKIQYLQIVASVIFGYFLDFSLAFLSVFETDNVILRLIMVVLGCAILGIGIFTEVHADVIMLPGEGFVKAVSVTLDKEFGATKVGVDISLTVIAIIISLVMFRQIKGVGIGTVIAAVITGMLSNFFGKLLSPFVDAFLAKKEKETDIQPEAVAAAEEQEQKRIVITIGRQYGCRAAEIGKILAEKLGINYYDKDLVDMVAEESGLTAEYVMKYQEKLTNSFLYDLYKTTFAITNNEQSRIDAMHYAEEKVIKRITSQESCVIMGRVANFALDDNENAFHVFLYTTPEEAVKNVMLQDGLDRGEAEKKIRHVNTKRSNYYKQFAKKEWGRADSYDLTINTGHYTVEKTADVILNVMHDCGKIK